jgi:hypothetical protein
VYNETNQNYEDLTKDEPFSNWNQGFSATAHMHHTHVVLDEYYVPQDDSATAIFHDMHIFMYAVMQEHLKTDRGESLISQYEATLDALPWVLHQWLSGDDFLRYIIMTGCPDDWRGTAFTFVLHWKEQVRKYERLELEAFLARQKLCMIQDAVGGVMDLAHVRQLTDLGVVNNIKTLTYDCYVGILLEA